MFLSHGVKVPEMCYASRREKVGEGERKRERQKDHQREGSREGRPGAGRGSCLEPTSRGKDISGDKAGGQRPVRDTVVSGASSARHSHPALLADFLVCVHLGHKNLQDSAEISLLLLDCDIPQVTATCVFCPSVLHFARLTG